VVRLLDDPVGPGDGICYNLGARPTNFSYPPETPSTVTVTLLPPVLRSKGLKVRHAWVWLAVVDVGSRLAVVGLVT